MVHYIPTRIGFQGNARTPTMVHRRPICSWDLRYYGWLDRAEERSFFEWAFGPFCKEQGCHEFVPFLLNKTVPTYIDSAAQFHVFAPLSLAEKELIDTYLEHVWQMLPVFLEQHRAKRLRRERRKDKRTKDVCNNAG